MATEALKSTSITNLDATPIVASTIGEGADGFLRAATDSVATTAGVTSGSTYKFVRIPTNAKVKRVLLTNVAQGATGAIDIDVAHSDSTADGTPLALQGAIVQITGPADNKLFGAATAITAAQKNQDQTFANTFLAAHQNLPLWQVLVNLGAINFTADPGGFFDIVAKTTATLANGGSVGIEVDYVL